MNVSAATGAGWFATDYDYDVESRTYTRVYRAERFGRPYSFGATPQVVAESVVRAWVAQQRAYGKAGEVVDTFLFTEDGDLVVVPVLEDDGTAIVIHRDPTGHYDLSKIGYAFAHITDDDEDLTDDTVRVTADDDGAVTFVVGLPVVLTVHGDGRVTYETDLSEAADLGETNAPEGMDDTTVAAYETIISNAVLNGTITQEAWDAATV
jgi:hypothetical protein